MGSCANGCAARPYVNYTGNDDYNPWTDEIHYQGFDNIGAAMMTLFIAAVSAILLCIYTTSGRPRRAR